MIDGCIDLRALWVNVVLAAWQGMMPDQQGRIIIM